MPAPTAKRPTRFHPFAGRDLPWLLDRQATARPDKPFIISEPADGVSQTFTYADFALETRRFAAGLASYVLAALSPPQFELLRDPALLVAPALALLFALAAARSLRRSPARARGAKNVSRNSRRARVHPGPGERWGAWGAMSEPPTSKG